MEISEADLLRSICRDSYADFFRAFWPTVSKLPLVWSWHIQLMCDEIQTVCENLLAGRPKLYDVVDNRPPGTSKSSAYSIFLAPWLWTRDPSLSVLGASFKEDVALDHSMKARKVVRSDLYRLLYPEVRISDDEDRKGRWATTEGGARQASGSGSHDVLGRHFDVIVLDDPIDPSGAQSRADLGNVNFWIENTLGDRFKDKLTGFTMLVSQRLVVDDPAGKMIQRPGVKWFCIPATLELGNVHPPELVSYYANGLMDPVRLPRSVLDDRRHPKKLGEEGYAAQFLQCLVAGTTVSTARGRVPIEAVRLGDEVLTREGYKSVRWAGKTKETAEVASVLFGNGSVLVGTPDHPVWTEDSGWVALDALGGGNYTYPLWDDQNCRRPSPSHSGALSTTEGHTSGISVTTVRPAVATSTGTSGGTIAATSPLATTFITRMGTRPTIRLRIWSASRNGNTAFATPIGRKSVADFLRKSVRSAGLGISRKRANAIIGNTVASPLLDSGSGPFTESTFVLPATSRSVLATIARRNTALAGAKSLAECGSTVSGARGATTNSLPPTPGRRAARIPAEQSSGGTAVVAVYDLSVVGAHEFYADGILVHNSPVPAGGGKFKVDKLRWGPKPVEYKTICRGWDKAVTPQKGAGLGRQPDFTSGVLVGIDTADRVWVLDVQRFRLDSFSREERMRRVAAGDGVGPVIAVEQEPGAGGEDSALATARRLLGYRVRLVKASGSKEARADDFSYAVNAGNVWLPDTFRQGNGWTGWATDFVEELRHFPHGPFDDQVDASSLAYSQVARPKIRVGAIVARRK